MSTRIYGASDDLIEFEGDVTGEVGFCGQDGDSALVVCDDGTVLVVKYGKPGDLAIWSITLLRRGELFDRIDVCESESEDSYSDSAHFLSGLKKAWVARGWESVK